MLPVILPTLNGTVSDAVSKESDQTQLYSAVGSQCTETEVGLATLNNHPGKAWYCASVILGLRGLALKFLYESVAEIARRNAESDS